MHVGLRQVCRLRSTTPPLRFWPAKFLFISHRASVKVTITTLGGVAVACLDVDATLQLDDLLALLPSQAGECSRRLLFGNTELKGPTSLSDIGVKEGSILALVFEVMLRVLTASGDRTAKVWSAAFGECLLTMQGHRDQVTSAVFSADGQQVLTASTEIDREGMVGCHGRVPAHHARSQRSSQLCSVLRRRPAGTDGFHRRNRESMVSVHRRCAAGVDCFWRQDRESLVGCLWGVSAHLERSRQRRLFCGLLGSQQTLNASWDRTAKAWTASSRECLLSLRGRNNAVCSFIHMTAMRCLAALEARDPTCLSVTLSEL